MERDQKPVEETYSMETKGLTIENKREAMLKEPEEMAASQKIPQPVSVLERVEDDWFVLFHVVPRTSPYRSPGTANMLFSVSAHSRNQDYYLHCVIPCWTLLCVKVASLCHSCLEGPICRTC